LNQGEVNAKGMSEILKLQQSIQLLFLNGCSNNKQVEAFTKANIPAVIATSQPVNDKYAQLFSTEFYKKLTSGEELENSIQDAYDWAKATVSASGMDIKNNRSLILEDDTEEEWSWGLIEIKEKATQWSLRDVEIITKFNFTDNILTPLLLQFNQLKKIDYGFLFSLIGIVFLGWIEYGKNNFNRDELHFWSLLIFLILTFWFFIRLIIKRYNSNKNIISKHTVYLSTFCIIISTSCLYMFDYTYKTPTFLDDKIGIHLARFKNDPSDLQQDKIFKSIEDLIKDFTYDEIDISKLPRKLKDDSDAKKYGLLGNSYLVLWGSVSPEGCNNSNTDCNDLNITTIKTRSLKNFVGWTLYDNLPITIKSSTGHINKDNLLGAIVEFLMGYYLISKSEEKPVKAVLHFSKSLNLLEDGKNDVSLSFKASILFYLGNSYLKCYLLGEHSNLRKDCAFKEEDKDKSISDIIGEKYITAAKIVSKGKNNLKKSRYVEALVNLAFLKIQPNIGNSKSLQERSEYAYSLLARADEVCDEKDQASKVSGYFPSDETCIIVSYNKGIVLQDMDRYSDSIDIFMKSLTRIDHLEENKDKTELPKGVLLSKLYQSIAYSFAKKFEKKPEAKYLDRAKKHLKLTEKINSKFGYSKPLLNILSARISILESNWEVAKNDLQVAKKWAKDNNYADYYILSAVIDKCLLKDNSQKNLEIYAKLKAHIDGNGSESEGYTYYFNKTEECY
jgi:hypothetical protein